MARREGILVLGDFDGVGPRTGLTSENDNDGNHIANWRVYFFPSCLQKPFDIYSVPRSMAICGTTYAG